MVTSVMFGGDALDVMFATSLGDKIGDLSPSGPDAGGVFAITGLGVKGILEPRFGG
jgi:sugar lactone lactonase YvrE